MKKITLSVVLIFAVITAFAQPPDTTKKSIPSTSEIEIGRVKTRINYYSPAVRNRIIFGGLVPYYEVWVTGAHYATTIEFSVPVEIDGKKIEAGKYALFTIPLKSEWTIILNKNWDQHLTDEYSEKEDVIRVNVPSPEASHTERLKYSINKISDSAIEIEIRWATVKVAFQAKFLEDTPTYKIRNQKSRAQQ